LETGHRAADVSAHGGQRDIDAGDVDRDDEESEDGGDQGRGGGARPPRPAPLTRPRLNCRARPGLRDAHRAPLLTAPPLSDTESGTATGRGSGTATDGSVPGTGGPRQTEPRRGARFLALIRPPSPRGPLGKWPDERR